VGGALWGSLIGALAGLSVVIVPDTPLIGGTPQITWAVIALGGTGLGALGAALLGFVIGVGISEEDIYLYDASVKHGVKLVRLHMDNERVGEAAQIMYQINAAARARTMEGTEGSVQTPSGQ